MSALNPIDFPQAYDALNIAGIETPGLAEVTTSGKSLKWEHKQAKGSTGATQTLQGRDLETFTVKLTLWKRAQFEEWETLKRLLDDSVADAKNPRPLDIAHPDLSEHGIRAAVVENISGRVTESIGRSTYTIKFTEYRRPVPSGGTPKGAPKGKGGDAVTEILGASRIEVGEYVDDINGPGIGGGSSDL